MFSHSHAVVVARLENDPDVRMPCETVVRMTTPPSSAEYEQLVESLVRQLAKRAPVQTERIQWDEDIKGHATTNQIDVVWDFVDEHGQPHRVVFEARSYKSAIKQGQLHAFRSVVDDIQDPTRPVTGVMVTTARYQAGAKAVASTYGVVVLELREPGDDELDGQLQQIIVNATPVLAIVEDVAFDAVELLAENVKGGIAMLGAFEVALADGQVIAMSHLLCDGELGTSNELRPVHEVRRDFDPPALLRMEGHDAARIRAVTASVGDFVAPPVTATIAGPEAVAWLLCNSLTGARAWIAEDGEFWAIDS